MTLVLAARCSDGVVVAGDTRVWEEPDVITSGVQRKVEAIDKQSVVGFAGYRYTGQCFIEKMQEAARSKDGTLRQLVDDAKRTLKDLWEEYGKPKGNNEADKERREEGELDTFVVSLDEHNEAQIYVVDTNGVPDKRDEFATLGLGGETGLEAVALLWDPALTVDEAWPMTVVVMKLVSSRHCSVGGTPIVYLVKDKIGNEEVPASEVETVYNAAESILASIPEYVMPQLKRVRGR